MTDDDENHKLLVSAEYIRLTAENCVENPRFDAKACGAEMIRHGYALLFGVSLDDAHRAINAMFATSDAFGRSTPMGMES